MEYNLVLDTHFNGDFKLFESYFVNIENPINMSLKFYKCSSCGNVAVKLFNSGVPMFCCGKPMEELIPNTVDASGEKHVPVVTRLDDNRIKVAVGSVEHPMVSNHYIVFIVVETEDGFLQKPLKIDGKPEAEFFVGSSKVKAVYEYCNLHGLWKTEL